jgi:opacity protein-like surface antigen
MTYGLTNARGAGLSTHLALGCLFLMALGNPRLCLGEDELSRLTASIGAGVNTPIGQTADFTHSGGALAAGLGYRWSTNQTVLLQYYFSTMPFNGAIIGQLGFLKPSSNLYSVTINYKREFRYSSPTRPYLIGGAGWYHRVATITRPSAVGEILCSSGLAFWDIACLEGTVPLDKVVAGSTSNAPGFNAGGGLSRRIGKTPARWYVEVRYHYAPYQGVATAAVPVMIGLTW